MHLHDDILERVLTGLPLRSLWRLKAVCREWKSYIESDIFRDLYTSLNRERRCRGWSLFIPWEDMSTTDIVAQYRCEAWELPRPLGSYVSSFVSDVVRSQEALTEAGTCSYVSSFVTDVVRPQVALTDHEAGTCEVGQRDRNALSHCVVACTDSLVLLYVRPVEWVYDQTYYLGNPVTRQLVKLPPPPKPHCLGGPDPGHYCSGLVTRTVDGLVSSYKVVMVESDPDMTWTISFHIYSSETGEWSYKHVRCPRPVSTASLQHPINFNGCLHWLHNDYTSIISHDFYAEDDDQCRIITFPNVTHPLKVRQGLTVCTISEGYLMHISVATKTEGFRITGWKLNNYTEDSGEWQLSWEIDLDQAPVEFKDTFSPIGMHPFDSRVLYLWSREKQRCVSCDLRTRRFTLHEDSEAGDGGSIQIFTRSAFTRDLTSYMRWNYSVFRLPHWLQPIPRPLFWGDLLPDVLP